MQRFRTADRSTRVCGSCSAGAIVPSSCDAAKAGVSTLVLESQRGLAYAELMNEHAQRAAQAQRDFERAERRRQSGNRWESY